MRECIPPNLHDPQRAKGPLDRRSKRLSFPHFFLRRKKCGRRRPPPRQGETDSPPQRRNPPRAKGSLNRRFEWFSLVAFFLQKKKATRARGRETPHPAPAGATPARRRGGETRASAFFVSDGPISSNSGRNGGKNAGRNCVSALPQRAMPVHCHPRFPSRNRRFPDRCRSPDCASTAFRCRCLLLRQKLFVLPCRRLRNNYILCPTGTPTFAALRRQRRDLIIATRPAHQPLPSLLSAAAAQAVQAIPEPTMLPTALHARVHTAKSA